MYDVIKKLTDEERKALFDTAIEEAELNNLPIDQVIGPVLRVFMENKFKQKMEEREAQIKDQTVEPEVNEWEEEQAIDPNEQVSEQEPVQDEWEEKQAFDPTEPATQPVQDGWEEEQSFDPTEPVTQPVQDGWEEEHSFNPAEPVTQPVQDEWDKVYSPEEMTDTLLGLYSEVNEAYSDASKMLGKTDYGKWDILNDANKGRIYDEEEYFGGKQNPSYGSGMNLPSVFVDLCKKISEKKRAAYYTHLAHSSDDIIEAERLGCIESYEELWQQGEIYSNNASPTSWKQNDHSTITFDRLASLFTKNGLSRVGMDAHRKGKPTSAIDSFDPMYYENEYDVASIYMDTSREEKPVQRIFDEAKEAIRATLEKLKGMSTSEFRKYKMDSMHLSDAERLKFEGELGMTHSQDFDDNEIGMSK